MVINKVKKKCPQCGKPAHIQTYTTYVLGKLDMRIFCAKCGFSWAEDFFSQPSMPVGIFNEQLKGTVEEFYHQAKIRNQEISELENAMIRIKH